MVKSSLFKKFNITGECSFFKAENHTSKSSFKRYIHEESGCNLWFFVNKKEKMSYCFSDYSHSSFDKRCNVVSFYSQERKRKNMTLI